MKLIFTILFIYCFSANATNYYFDNSGSDLNAGTSPATAWQTVAKLNSSTFNPGDSLLFNRNGTWNERLKINSSGTQANPIVISSYGTGNKPLITGLQIQTGFSNTGGNIWQATATNAVANENTVLIDGVLTAKCRYPNTGYLTFTSYSGDSSVTGSLSGTPNYTGAECVTKTSGWVTDRTKISSQSSGTLNFTPNHLTYTPMYGGNGYFIQNSQYALDVVGEWYYSDTAKHLIVYATASPNVQISTIDTVIWLSNKTGITFDGLNITGANKAGFQIDTSNNIVIKNCSINNCGTLGISGLKSPHVTMINDSIQNCLSGAIYLRQVDPYTPTVNTCDSAIVVGNYIHRIAIYPGMGLNSNGRYMACYIIGLDVYIVGNTLDSIGYIGVIISGKRNIVRNNFLNSCGMLKTDGGAIYSAVGGYLPTDYNDNSVISSNIITNGIRNSTGTVSGFPFYSLQNTGIYTDDYARYLTIDSNTVYNCTSGMLANDVTGNINVRNNNFFGNLDAQILWTSLTSSRNLYYTRNAYYSKTGNNIINGNFTYSTVANLGTLDSNYYSHTNNESQIIYFGNTIYSLSGWQPYSSLDLHSVGTPSGITSSDPLLFYNTNSTAQTYTLTGNYKSIRGVSYNNSITLQPFTSAILFKNIYDKYGLRFKKAHK